MLISANNFYTSVKTIFGIPQDQLKKLIILYSIAHGGIFLILQSIYWDDWLLWNMNSEIILNTFRQAGSPFNFVGYLHNILLSVGPWFYRVLTFILIFLSGILLWHILKRSELVDETSIFLIVLFYLTTPLYIARVAVIDFPYTLCVFLFYFAWFVQGRFRLLSLALYFLSFNTQSLLVFYTLPMLDYLFRENNKFSFGSILRWGVGKLDFIMLPFVWFIIKIIYFKPTGFYKNYNEIYSLLHLIKSPVYQLWDMLNLDVGLVLIGLLFFFFFNTKHIDISFNERKPKRLLVIATVCLVFALVPYWILGHIPTFREWTSRHQLLMPLGTSFLFAYFISIINRLDQRKIFVAIFFSVFISINVSNYFDLIIDWKKQNEIAEFLRNSEEVKKSDVILFNDKTKNALDRLYRNYEWNGLLKLATGSEMKFGITKSEYSLYQDGYFDTSFNTHSLASDHERKINSILLEIIIQKGSLKNVFKNNFKFYIFEAKIINVK